MYIACMWGELVIFNPLSQLSRLVSDCPIHFVFICLVVVSGFFLFSTTTCTCTCMYRSSVVYYAHVHLHAQFVSTVLPLSPFLCCVQSLRHLCRRMEGREDIESFRLKMILRFVSCPLLSSVCFSFANSLSLSADCFRLPLSMGKWTPSMRYTMYNVYTHVHVHCTILHVYVQCTCTYMPCTCTCAVQWCDTCIYMYIQLYLYDDQYIHRGTCTCTWWGAWIE